MRICYIADGRYVHTHRWMQFFKGQGHEVHLISTHFMDASYIQIVRDLGGVYHGWLGGFHVKRFWKTLRELSWLRSTLRRENIDVLHCHYLSANAWYGALSRFRPLVITVMGGGDVCGPDWRPQGVREKLLTPFTLKSADLITSWSRQMANTVRPFCRPETPIEVIHGGIKLDKFHAGPAPDHLRARWDIPPEAKVIFSPRLIRPLSNIDKIALAFSKLCERNSADAYLLLAGPREEINADYEKQVRELVKGSAGAARTRFVGAIPHHEMADYYRLADVTISIPSTDGTPMSVLESMACGTPVVASAIPDYDREYIDPGRTVLAAKHDDVEEIAQRLTELLRDQDLSRKISSEALQRVQATGSFETQMSRMEELYQDLFP